ncbi:MAG: cell division protein FtsQ/DivIB [Treponemataceae bacterium]
MAESQIYSDINQFYPFSDHNQSPRKKNPDAKAKILPIIVIIIFTVLAIELLLYFVVLPLSTGVDVEFTGLNHINEEDLLQKSSLLFSQSWGRLDQETISAFFYDHPLIANISVEKKLPNHVIVNVEERVPIAMAIVLSGDKSIPISIDKKGVVFQVDGHVSEKLPLISGLNFESVQVGMRVHSKLRPFLEKLSEIAETNPSYLESISEIQILPKDYGNYDLAIYPMKSKIKVLVDRTFDESVLHHMMIALDVVNSIEKNVYEIDLRYGTTSYHIR